MNVLNRTESMKRRRNELLDAQLAVLNSAQAAHRPLSADEKQRMAEWDKELAEINKPRETAVYGNVGDTSSRFTALAGKYTGRKMDVDSVYVSNFWKSLKTADAAQAFAIRNAALGEGGTAADGSYLVPIETDPTISAMAMVECSARSLSKVITTDMNINIPYQSAKSVAAIKAESNNSGTNAFGTSAPQFSTTMLSAFVVGNSVFASWELLEDAKAANAFIPAELQRAIRTEEESLFINGTGSNQPQGYLGNATTATGASITDGGAALGIDPILDTVGCLNRAYYANARWLVNRQEAIRLYKAQVANNQFQTYFTFDANGNWRLLGFPMEFSYEMPAYVASPEVNGQWLFGDFNAFAVIGDRGETGNIRVKVLDQVSALNGQTVLLGYRRTDQRIVLQEAVVNFQATS
jgi:HK97 family phage major capsid protein